jgi:hypothetical protein
LKEFPSHVKSIRWQRVDGRRMPAAVVAYSGRLIFNKDGEHAAGTYECLVETNSNRIIRKELTIEPPSSSSVDQKKLHVKIVPIHLDTREGGRVELECQTGKFNK